MPIERHYIHGDPCEAGDGTYYCASGDLFVQLDQLDRGAAGQARYRSSRTAAARKNTTRWRVVLDARGNAYL